MAKERKLELHCKIQGKSITTKDHTHEKIENDENVNCTVNEEYNMIEDNLNDCSMTKKGQQKESVVNIVLGQGIVAGHKSSDNETLNSLKETSRERRIREIVEESRKLNNAQKSTTIKKKVDIEIECGEMDTNRSSGDEDMSMSDSDDSVADKTWRPSKDDVCYNSDSSENESGFAAKKKQKYDTNNKTNEHAVNSRTTDMPMPDNEIDDAIRNIVDHEEIVVDFENEAKKRKMTDINNNTNENVVDRQTADVPLLVNETEDNVMNAVDHEEIVLATTANTKRKRAKQGMAKAEEWTKNVNKDLRMKGEVYKGIARVDGKKTYCLNKQNRILIDSDCTKRCTKTKSCKSIMQDQKEAIHQAFWSEMNWDEKRAFAVSHVDISDARKQTDDGRRSKTYTYFLKAGNERVNVCKKMFLSTLGIGEAMLYGWFGKVDINGMITRKPVKSPKMSEKDLEKRNKAREFLESIPKVESHYCRATTDRLYVEPCYKNFTDLFKTYTRFCRDSNVDPLSRVALMKMFRNMNMSIYHPKKDQCDICTEHTVGNLDDESYQKHIGMKDRARQEKQTDKEATMNSTHIKVLTMDLQSVLVCPFIMSSAAYFRTKLTCHNFTTFDLKTRNVSCYLWHEGELGLSANTFASCIVDEVERMVDENTKEIILYSDGCGYQNRNAILANALLYTAVKSNVKITQKFLVKGHTQMEVDSVHSAIEKQLRASTIYSPAGYIERFKRARSDHPYAVRYLTHTFAKDYE